MPDYLVTWQIDIEADSPEEAAARALIVQRDAESTATVFDVEEKTWLGGLIRKPAVRVDLSAEAV